MTDPTLAFGLSTITDYSPELPFLDLMKMSRPMWGYSGYEFSSMGHDALSATGVFDEQGWPTEIPDGLSGLRTMWAMPAGTAGFEGPFVLTWEGEGSVNVERATVTATGENRIVFTNPGAADFWLNITATDPNDNGNYIKNIRIVPEKYEAIADLGELFNPDFLAVVEDVRQLRFMDWMLTNGSVQEEWADRPQLDDITWSGQGTPVEIMVALANKTGTDPWFNIPHLATDEYIEQFATYVRDHLNPDLVAHFEWSNEVWNFAGGFGQSQWLLDQVDTDRASYTGEYDWPQGQAWVALAGKYFVNMAQILGEVFEGQMDRIERVLGVQTSGTGEYGIGRQMVEAQIWQQHEPDAYIPPYSLADAIAVTPYVGNGHFSGNAAQRDELLAYRASHTAEETWDWLKAEFLTTSIPGLATKFQYFRTLADSHGLDLLAYEGGQHMTTSTAGTREAALTAIMLEFVNSQQMAEIYAALWDAWAAVGDGPFMQFQAVGAPSKYGAWGLIPDLDGTNPRADFLFGRNAEQNSWFGEGGGTQYQQGVIKFAGDSGETIVGTDKDDMLVGGDGNDTIIAGKGNDGVDGGGGDDSLAVPGLPSDYAIRPAATGYWLIGPLTSSLTRNVEELSFDDGSTSPISDLVTLPDPQHAHDAP